MHDYRMRPFENMIELKPMTDYNIVPENQPHEIRLREIPDKANPTSIQVRFFTFVLDAKITASATTINMDFDKSTPFKQGDMITIDGESILISSISGNVVTVVRGQEGTLAVEHTPVSITDPIRAYGSHLGEVAAEPAPNQYRPDYTTAPDDDESWNTGLIKFNTVDANKFVEISYNGIGTLASAERSGNDPLRNYGYDPETDIIAVLNGTVNLSVYNECQLFYVRKSATANRASFPGVAVKVTCAAIVDGNMMADYCVPASCPGFGGGGGGYGNGLGSTNSLYNGVVFIGRSTPTKSQQDLYLESASVPFFWGGGGNPSSTNIAGGAGGGGICVVAPYCNIKGFFYARGGAGTNGGVAGGGGSGGVIVIAGERVINSAQFNVAAGSGGAGTGLGGGTPGVAGVAGWVRVIEYGGRN